jgi:hypothetical protein
MTTTDLLILLAGALLLAVVAALLVRWRRDAVQDVVRPAGSPDPCRPEESIGARMPSVRGRLLWLLVERGSQSTPSGGNAVAPGVISEARALLARGRKIEAIKLARELTGWGLKESKDFVDGLHWRCQPVFGVRRIGAGSPLERDPSA